MSFSPLIRQLIDALRTLPGVGQKTAQRMALQLLERDRSGGTRLAQALSQAMEGVGHCRQCRTLTEEELCPQCADPRRDDTLLCVVEGPMDVYAVEQTGYRGRYFVLKGHLSPLDGLGPEAIGIPQLVARIEEQGTFTEVILATNPTVDLIKRTGSVPMDQWPPAVAEPLPVDAAALIKQLRALGQTFAERLDMAPELMLRKKTLEALVKSGYPDGPYQLPDSLRGWRRELMGQALLDSLANAGEQP